MGVRSNSSGIGGIIYFELPLFTAAMMNTSPATTNPTSGLDIDSRATMYAESPRALILVDQPTTVPTLPPPLVMDQLLNDNATGAGFADLVTVEMEENDEHTEYCNTHREDHDSSNGDDYDGRRYSCYLKLSFMI